MTLYSNSDVFIIRWMNGGKTCSAQQMILEGSKEVLDLWGFFTPVSDANPACCWNCSPTGQTMRSSYPPSPHSFLLSMNTSSLLSGFPQTVDFESNYCSTDYLVQLSEDNDVKTVALTCWMQQLKKRAKRIFVFFCNFFYITEKILLNIYPVCNIHTSYITCL